MNDFVIRYLNNLPDTVNGFTVPSEDGFYNIYINPRLSSFMQTKTILHEINHIKNNDFYLPQNASEIEIA